MKLAIAHRSILVAFLALVVSVFAPLAHAATDPYLKIAEGDSRARVVSLLGEPADPGRDLSAAERKNIRSALKAIGNKNGVEFVIWKRSSQLYYLVGFDKGDTVVAKHRVFAVAAGK